MRVQYVLCVCVVRARQSDRHARFDGGPVVPASGISHAVEPYAYRGTRLGLRTVYGDIMNERLSTCELCHVVRLYNYRIW